MTGPRDVQRKRRNKRRARDYGYELLDRTHVLAMTFCEHITEHPGAAISPEIHAKIQSVEDALYDLYQLIGRKVL